MASPSCDATAAVDTAAWSAARLATAAELRTPLHFPGGARDFRRRWPAFEAWTATTLLNPPYADVPVNVELSELRAFTSYEPDADAARHLLRLDENRANAASRRWTTTLGTFVRYTLGRSERAPYAYLSVPLARILRDTPDRSHGKQFVNDVMRVDDGGTALIDDDTIQVDDELVVAARRARASPMVSLWAGGANVTTQAHYDLHANLFVRVMAQAWRPGPWRRRRSISGAAALPQVAAADRRRFIGAAQRDARRLPARRRRDGGRGRDPRAARRALHPSALAPSRDRARRVDALG